MASILSSIEELLPAIKAWLIEQEPELVLIGVGILVILLIILSGHYTDEDSSDESPILHPRPNRKSTVYDEESRERFAQPRWTDTSHADLTDYQSAYDLFEIERFGRQGERYVSSAIHNICDEGDTHLLNIVITVDDRETELDNIIINRNGIFVIEVKNYVGYLRGNEDDDYWEKIKVTEAGNAYTKEIRNPIRQMKREVFLLAQFLRSYGEDIWVNGYVYLVEQNSPVESRYILQNMAELDRIIHTPGNVLLTSEQINDIASWLF